MSWEAESSPRMIAYKTVAYADFIYTGTILKKAEEQVVWSSSLYRVNRVHRLKSKD